ncbi:hypothetical protein CFC21_019100 [Triticum aestivum]|uniref:Ataxin 2 SM domain-containing protein n=3 Tax=Triticum TaxID=4564 RepID=A0A9R1P5I1_TRITD|nr:uncharacterized protein LOC119356551 isoform X1 [Triticum dicoccoides]XP_044459090.1 uncharacterized protein LOC123190504 isoform X1 [Triticum aestivum]KAF7003816.1 hypothetical protein CFC21_019100 [Triticum aestivum]VAH36865.1 unnamed protein product [Triticum turgidum subsp. durum]
MARPKKAKAAPAPAPPAVCEALLLATVCMVGLPVEVQVRDGSAYAGVFHTASLDAGYGVVLKKARKIANGKDNANLVLGAFVDTLVVLPDDLVQVIAKDFSLATKDISKTSACDVVAASGLTQPQTSHLGDPKASRQVEKCSRLCQNSDNPTGKIAPMNSNAANVCSPIEHIVPNWNAIPTSADIGSKEGNVVNSVLATPVVASNVKTSQPINNSSIKAVMSSKTTAKESKLNPHAKVFAPSFASSRPVLAAASPVNPNYISNSVSGVPTGVPVFQTHSHPGSSSLSSKVVHYNNLAPGNFGMSPQYVQSVVGHNVGRLDPARLGTPYHPLQVGSTYISPSPQPMVDGKFSPVVYVHPVSQDAMRGTPVMSQVWPRPLLLNSHQGSLQKFQAGTAPFFGAPPVMATGNLPMVMPSPATLVQPFQAIHPIMVPSATSMYPGKYM